MSLEYVFPLDLCLKPLGIYLRVSKKKKKKKHSCHPEVSYLIKRGHQEIIILLVLSRSELLDRARTPMDQATSDAVEVEETISVLALSSSSLLDSTSMSPPMTKNFLHSFSFDIKIKI